MNSVHEGLYNGIPLVVIPQSADRQQSQSKWKSWSRSSVHMNELTVRELRESVELVLNPSYKEVALNLKESFRTSGGYKEAVDEIFTFVGQ